MMMQKMYHKNTLTPVYLRITLNTSGEAFRWRTYAWIHDTDDPAKPKRHVTVLPPVVSPQTAVKAAIVQEFKERASAS
jgi:hypothetical protein